MSSNHVYVSRREWEEMRNRVANPRAYVINEETELRRLQELEQRRRREIERIQLVNQRAVEQSLENLVRNARNQNISANREIRSRLQDRRQDFQRQMESMIHQIRNLSGRLDETDRRVDTLARDFNAQFQNITAQISQRRDRAEAICQELDNFLDQIRILNPEKFLPGQFASLSAIRASLEANIQAGDYQAAILLSQNSILTASRMLSQLVIMNENYNQQLFQTQNDAQSLAARLDAFASSHGVLAVEANGQSQELEYDIGYWSNGRFEQINRQFQTLQTAVQSGQLSQQDLVRARQEIARLEQILDQCDQQARGELAGAVFVEDTASQLYETLTERGWMLEDSGFHGDDARNPYTMQYEDGNGSTVSVVVSRGATPEKPVYAIEVFSDDTYRAETIKEGVHRSVSDQGLRIQGITRRNDCRQNPTPQAFQQNMVREYMQARKR